MSRAGTARTTRLVAIAAVVGVLGLAGHAAPAGALPSPADAVVVDTTTTTVDPTTTTGVPLIVGKTPVSAGRSTPGNLPSTIFAIAMQAPVLPAEIKPSALPLATRRAQACMELSRFDRAAFAAWSSIVMRSGACSISIGRDFAEGCESSSR